ncbi:MAG: 50S ribosomal protein L6 [Candidatus Micrarchaeota archaeon]
MDIPQGITIKIDEGKIIVSGAMGIVEQKFNSKHLEVKTDEKTIEVTNKTKETKKIKAMVNTIKAHIKNAIKGVSEGYEKKLALVYAHFPVTIELKGKEILVKNFLGEKTPRKAKIRGEAKVEVKGQEILVSGINKEDVTQTASNLVKVTKIRAKDNRVFQDGIYYE